MQYGILGGEANSSGFEIKNFHPLIEKTYCTKNYKKDEKGLVKNATFYAFATIVIFFPIIISFLILGMRLESLILIILYNLLIVNLIIFLIQLARPFLMILLFATEQITLFNSQSIFLRQWHACEHKIMHLLEYNEDLTIENFKEAPRIHPRDSGQEIIFDYLKELDRNLIFICLTIFALLLIARDFLLLPLLSILFLTFIIYLYSKNRTFIIFIFYLLQILNTAEPEEWQAEESLKLASKIKKDYEQPWLV